MNINFSTVVDYVKRLFPVASARIVPSDNPAQDARLLAFLASGNVFFLRATNGLTYLYFVPTMEENLALGRYIMCSNGLKPREHLSAYFWGQTPVLRVPRREIKSGTAAKAFVDNVLENANLKFDASFVNGRIEQIRKKMNQNVK